MGKKKDLLTLEQRVKHILEENYSCRNNDPYLITVTYGQILSEKGYDLNSMGFAYVMNNTKALGLPPMESITRFRRKAQAENEELEASEEVTRYRAGNEEVFREVMR